MRTLSRYLSGVFMVTLLSSLAVFTFVMCIGILFKATDLLARGVSWEPVIKILMYGFPQAMSYSIPMSVMTACLLVFGRLSADGEITAMKASGVNLWSIVRAPLLIAIAATLVCVFINGELAPEGHYARRKTMAQMGVETPLELLEEGRFIRDIPGMTVYIGRRKGNLLQNIRIYDLRKPGIQREIRATSGRILDAADPNDLQLELFGVRVDPFRDDRPGAAYMESWPLVVEDAIRKREYRRKQADMTFGELFSNIRNVEAEYPHLDEVDLRAQQSKLNVELHCRLAVSCSCLAFAILGIPLGITAHRRESSVGVGMSLILVFNFYLFIIIAESLAEQPAWQPHLIAWLPVSIAGVLGALLINRAN